LHDLTVLRRVFVSALIDLHHTRVNYPAASRPEATGPALPRSEG
jgi:hypothetical protein